MIIDTHTHVWLHDEELHWDSFIRECRANEVALAIVSCLAADEQYPSPATVRAANANAKRFNSYAAGLTQWLAYINPQNTNWGEELAACLEDGAIGIKLWISLKDSAGNTDHTNEVVDVASKKNLPVLIHTFNRTDPVCPGEFDIEAFASLAERFPKAALIAAHAGSNWRQSRGVLRDRAPNAFVDVSGCYPQRGMVEQLVEDIGVERILFGSDMIGRSLPSQLAKVEFADVSREEKELILWKNAIKAYRLEAVPAVPSAPHALRALTELPDPGVDNFCFCGQWPFFETPHKTPHELNDMLEQNKIRTAFTADLGGIYRFDIETANSAFIEACAQCDHVAPLAVVNPLACNWRSVVKRLGETCAGVIVYPYLHNWRLDDPAHADMFRVFAEYAFPVWINASLGDVRFSHWGQNCRPVSEEEVIAFVESAPENAYVFQGLDHVQIGALLSKNLPDSFRFEISRLTDGTGALATVLKQWGHRSLVMGSEFPFRDIREVMWTARRQ